jgi:hypothetical protein
VRRSGLFALFVLLASIASARSASAQLEGCPSCHPAATERADHRALLEKHRLSGCVVCHRGVRRAKTASAAHAKDGSDELLSGVRVAASCAPCHVAGSVRGTEALAVGAAAYLELGCAYCHRAGSFGGIEPLGPGLDAIGMRGSPHLRAVLEDPRRVFPLGLMPRFGAFVRREPDRAEALITYLLSLRARPRAPPPEAALVTCEKCHAGGAREELPVLSRHRCAWILAERTELRCTRCHAKALPWRSECAYLTMRRKSCGGCHELEGAEHGD